MTPMILRYLISALFVISLMVWIKQLIDALKAKKKKAWRRIAVFVLVVGVASMYMAGENPLDSALLAFQAIFVFVILGYHMLVKPLFSFLGKAAGVEIPDDQLTKAQSDVDKAMGDDNPTAGQVG